MVPAVGRDRGAKPTATTARNESFRRLIGNMGLNGNETFANNEKALTFPRTKIMYSSMKLHYKKLQL